MYKNLYTKFSNWYHGGTIYLYSDPHFNDEETRLLRKYNIPDEEIVKRINSYVGRRDTLIILGDIGDESFVKQLRAGWKVLVLGNHDKGATKYEGIFDEIYEGTVMISDKILLSHEPVEFEYALNIHGHDHSNTQFRDSKHFNVCCEWHNYYPVPLKEIINSGRLHSIPNIHRTAIDKASKK